MESGLLEWASKRDAWQQDLLRQLATGVVLGQQSLRAYADAAERAEMQKISHFYAVPGTDKLQEFEPLTAAHLNTTEDGADPVRLAKIIHVHGANGLADGAALEPHQTGLTIIAGKNGSGKSGYTRILKQVAACRASEAVLPNAFRSTQVPRAVVEYTIGNASIQSLTWQAADAQPEGPLQRVRIFDTAAANVHLAGATEIAYVPATLQILAEYTRALNEIHGLISADLQSLKLQSRNWPELEIGSGADLFAHLGQEAALQTLKGVKPLSAEEQEELDELPTKVRNLSSSDPATLSAQARQRATQLTVLARNLELISAKVSSDAVAASENLIDNLQACKAKADDARSLVKAEGKLTGTGGEAWQALWQAAEVFYKAEHSHDQTNALEDSDVCPLCQQDVDEESKARFTQFAQFMSGEAQLAWGKAKELRENDVNRLKELPWDAVRAPEVTELISIYDENTAVELAASLHKANAICDRLISSKREAESSGESSLEAAFTKGIERIRDAADLETKNADDLAKTDTSAEAVARLQGRQAELKLRKGLADHLEGIAAQHDRFARATCLEASLKACNTTSASRKNSDLSASYVGKVCEGFTAESKKLGLDRVPVELVFDKSSKGTSYIRVALTDAAKAPVPSVLSEGEQRVTAIAGFFADLTESGDFSTLIFDDPVSSLDQVFRVKVARRLLEEAEKRQVLVFTHDFSFVQYLYEEKQLRDKDARTRGEGPAKDIHYLHIERSAEGAGALTSAVEWRHVSVKVRIGRLKDRLQAAGALYRKNAISEYESLAREIVGAMRDTWEFFVEQELLNGVVTRHERRVQTQRLQKLIDLSPEDIATVDLGMSIESRFMTGHSAPVSDGSAAMTPNDLEEEIKRLEEFKSVVNARRM
nr:MULTISPECIES: AAA family ATPase [unclassified Leucobacter]